MNYPIRMMVDASFMQPQSFLAPVVMVQGKVMTCQQTYQPQYWVLQNWYGGPGPAPGPHSTEYQPVFTAAESKMTANPGEAALPTPSQDFGPTRDQESATSPEEEQKVSQDATLPSRSFRKEFYKELEIDTATDPADNEEDPCSRTPSACTEGEDTDAELQAELEAASKVPKPTKGPYRKKQQAKKWTGPVRPPINWNTEAPTFVPSQVVIPVYHDDVGQAGNTVKPHKASGPHAGKASDATGQVLTTARGKPLRMCQQCHVNPSFSAHLRFCQDCFKNQPECLNFVDCGNRTSFQNGFCAKCYHEEKTKCTDCNKFWTTDATGLCRGCKNKVEWTEARRKQVEEDRKIVQPCQNYWEKGSTTTLCKNQTFGRRAFCESCEESMRQYTL